MIESGDLTILGTVAYWWKSSGVFEDIVCFYLDYPDLPSCDCVHIAPVILNLSRLLKFHTH